MNIATNSFELVKSREIPALKISVEEYRHAESGAEHIHIKSDYSENVFMVALRTVPMDSSGVAHVLEHTALCGSKKYPVRDPFFMMIRRSLNTFMNAFTSSDWTAYPFASQNRKDFNNLLDVYLDAVFFPNLNPLDFAQEGHRLELTDPNDPESPLEIKGVVYNEMKGAMSSPVSTLWQSLTKYLYPTTTYHYNSGGDPEHIPELTHEQLVAFHQTHYHPSNAIFMTFGDIEADEHQQKFLPVLSQFENSLPPIRVGLEQRYSEPQAFEEYYALAETEPQEKATHVVLGWLLGSSTDLKASLEAQLLELVLLENSSSPLLQALETSDLGRSPSPLCGADHSQREMCFVTGLEGCDPESAAAVEQLVLGVFEKVAQDGIDQSDLDSCLHQLEMQQREISGDSYPYGLQLMLTALNSATHGAEPIDLLDLEPALKQLRQDCEDPDFVKNLCRNLLLENPHRVRLTLKPDQELSKKRESALQAQLSQLRASMDKQEIEALVNNANALAERQNQEDDPSLLPSVGLEDVPKEMAYTPAEPNSGSQPLTRYAAGTNGLVYQMAICELPNLSSDELYLLPLLTHLMSEVGTRDLDYLQTQKLQSAICGGINLSFNMRGTPDNAQDVRGYMICGSKALYRNYAAMTDLMASTLDECRLDETDRIRELVAQTRARSDSGITASGHALAMTAAAQHFSPVTQMNQFTGGLDGLKSLRNLDDGLGESQNREALVSALQALHAKLRGQKRQWVTIAERDQLDEFSASLSGYLSADIKSGSRLEVSPVQPKASNQMWIANTQVHFCAKAFPTVTTNHPDAANLTVLGGVLRNLYLHPAIREKGGAYGGGASQDNNSGSFRFYSYRDPRLSETLSDFDASISQFLEQSVDPRHIEEAILGVVSSLDKPSSPAGEAKQSFMAELYGRSRAVREEFRKRVLEVKLDDLRRVSSIYLTKKDESTAVLTHADSEGLAEELNLSVHKL
ncbi:MAG: peptidase M16 [Porticoccaceae bacterium]|jgi:presequence protease|nr:peptidase M16 [Porticoccaceae bacterium]